MSASVLAPSPQAASNASAPPHAAPAVAAVLQEWSPLHAAVNGQVAKLTFGRMGLRTLDEEEVRTGAADGGVVAHRNAKVLFAHCEELTAAGDLEVDIFAMEMAIGSGVHAVQLLDHFEALCIGAHRDYYDRLTFFACDIALDTIAQARDHGIFDRHPQRVVLGLSDALDPARLLRLDSGEAIDLTGRLRAVYHNLALSRLPRNLFRRSLGLDQHGRATVENWALVIHRLVLRYPEELLRFTRLTVEELQTIAQGGDPTKKQLLAPLFPLIDVDLALAAVDITQLSEGPDLVAIAQAMATDLANRDQPGAADAFGTATAAAGGDIWVVHSAAATYCLEKTLEILRPDGYICYSDFGPATAHWASAGYQQAPREASIAWGLNHFAIDRWLTSLDNDGNARSTLSIPRGESAANIKHRLAGRGAIPATRNAFEAQFDGSADAKVEQILDIARYFATPQAQRIQAYRQALVAQPENWLLLAEAGEFALRHDNNAELGHLLLTEALRFNPWHLATAWNALGDLYRAISDVDRAQHAYEQAIRAKPEDHHSYINLAAVYGLRCNFARALEFAALGIARDTQGHDFESSKAVFDGLLSGLLAQRQVGSRLRSERDANPER